MKIEKLKFDDKGLIPAIVQDASTGCVLTLAYMNQESLNITLNEGRTCFFSRSRNCLWRKGEQSGNVQKVVRIRADCDGDALLVEVEPAGPACHTGAQSCFFDRLAGEGERFTLSSLAGLIKNRREQPKEGSYTNYLFDKGREKILKKVGEESAEVIVAAMKDSPEETIYELADLCYHALVLMEEMGIPVSRVMAELSSRHVVDKKTKQETMK